MNQMVGQVLKIREVLGRQQIKVVFIGRTSSGKSTLINALLGEKVLPTGLGHTTSCFVQVEGTSSNSPSLLVPLGEGGSLVETQVESLPSLVSALGSARLDEHSLAVLRWPSARCPLLEDDVVLVDSPGIDVSTGFDSWIDENCADADIFVLVANAESTLMMREKSFFKEVAERISKPNMVIVENRWDCAEDEEVYEGAVLVQEQHLSRCAAFLVDELGVAGRAEVPHRVFFTSGKEALKQRLTGEKGVKDAAEERHQQQQQGRLAEFRRLERLLADCLSSTLVATKYCSHTRNGRTICANVIKEFYSLLQAGAALETAWVKTKNKLEEKLASSETEMCEVASELRGEVEQMLTLVRQRVVAVMKQEVLALPVLIRDFPGRYRDDEVVLGVYIRELEKFLEHGLSVSVRGRIGRQVDSTVVDGQEQMVRRIAIQLPEERRAEFLETIPTKNPFETNFHVESLAHKDFRFIPRFQFSWGMISWARACMPLLSQLLPRWPSFQTSLSSPVAPSPSPSLMTTSRIPIQHAAFFSKVAIAALASQNSVIGTLASSVILRRVSLRLFGLVCLAHGALYLFERGRWQWWGGQERQVQQEFLRHLQAKLHLQVPQVASTVCHQIQGELHSTLATVCALVEGTQHCLYR